MSGKSTIMSFLDHFVLIDYSKTCYFFEIKEYIFV